MIPILFNHDATSFENHGIGDLVETIECMVKQTSEGEYELSLKYPINGSLFSELAINKLILAKTNDHDPYQPFRIYSIENTLGGTVTINAQHISYDLSGYPVKIFKDALSPNEAITKLKQNIVSIDPNDAECPFKEHLSGYNVPAFSSASTATYTKGQLVTKDGGTWQCLENITVGGPWNSDQWSLLEKFEVAEPKSIREVLLDGDDSILGLFGGDIILNGYNVSIVNPVDYENDRGVVIEYGVDLIEMTQEKNISETVTGVFPYWKGNVRGHNEKTDYEIYNGTTFDSGTTYYTRSAKYTQTYDTQYNIAKNYYVLDSGAYRGIVIADMDFKSGTTYYEASNATYYNTSDPGPIAGKVYYILENGSYRLQVASDLDFKSGLTYFERNGDTYTETQDAHYIWTKTYYLDQEVTQPSSETGSNTGTGTTEPDPGSGTTDPGTGENEDPGNGDNTGSGSNTGEEEWNEDPGSGDNTGSGSNTGEEEFEEEFVEVGGAASTTYRVITSDDLIFRYPSTVCERTENEYSQVTGPFNPNKSYYIPTTNLGTFMPISMSDMTLKSGVTYYEEDGFSYTPATPVAGNVYYVSDKYTDEEVIVYGDIQYADGYGSLPATSQKIEPVDLSEFFEAEESSKVPKKADLNKKAKQYILANDVGTPAINLTVKYATLGQDVRLYDIVTVRFIKLGIDTKARVTSYQYDVLKEQCAEIEVKNAKAISDWTSLEDASRLRKGLIPPSRIGKKSITSEQIGTGEIGSSNIASSGVRTANIEKDAVTTSKIKDNAIIYNKIEDGAIVSSKIQNGAVVGQKILDEAVSLKKLDKSLQIFYADIIQAMTIFSDKAYIDRYVEAAGLYANFIFRGPYEITGHTHYFRETGNGYLTCTSGADWSGAEHPFDMRATTFYQNEVARLTATSVTISYTFNETTHKYDITAYVHNSVNPSASIFVQQDLHTNDTAYIRGQQSVPPGGPIDSVRFKGCYTGSGYPLADSVYAVFAINYSDGTSERLRYYNSGDIEPDVD